MPKYLDNYYNAEYKLILNRLIMRNLIQFEFKRNRNCSVESISSNINFTKNAGKYERIENLPNKVNAVFKHC